MPVNLVAHNPPLVTALHGFLRSEQPNNNLYIYEGTIDLLTSVSVLKPAP